MNTPKLYIIGNGFDLWHEIPSNYWQFKDFVRKHDKDLLDTVDNYLPAGDDWSDLESALGAIDIDNIVDDLGHFMPSYGADDWSESGHGDFQYEVDRLVQRLSTRLKLRFGQWIRQLPIPTAATVRQRLQTIDPTARFLTFNYTLTLRDLYGVPDSHVLHIHGRADLPDGDLVLGHSWSPLERKSLNDRPDIEDIDTRLMEANNILDTYFTSTFKPSAELIRIHHPFFELLAGIEEVIVLGHSLSEVDEAYFKALLAIPSVVTARWQIACRSNDDPNTKLTRLQELGVQATAIMTCAWDDI
ncbi:hypothetical protein HNO92_002209 [Chromobacterium alkanivorans]|uniref:bacteriophage abortive infection AbiH family protein n=1 Tax=Chromobacterium alkanivorans TaxID=1071719 RepID=UPI002166E115|nr:bacteriophage abortive infection AbiH family protein [Chromobacterium alkanivorans]MCS3805054.1 hypothetical protein [Chromobacterium alkanivorans]MCS3819383.1 hypothetical protein [Chromobacterium alkanivorans]MCS3873895.1 hypothetical protein [Chromobacterium alkanivorans]